MLDFPMPKNNFKLIAFILFSFFIAVSYKARAFTKYVIYEGNTYRVESPEVLGDDDDDDKDEDEDEDKEDSKGSDKKDSERKKESEKKKIEKDREDGKKQQERIRESAKKEIERSKSPEQKIKADIKQEIKLERFSTGVIKDDDEREDDDNEIEIEDENEEDDLDDSLEKSVNVQRMSKFKKIEIKREDDGRIKIKAEGFDDTFESSESADILNFIPKNMPLSGKIKIKAENGKIEFESESVNTGTKLPVSVDSKTNTLRVQTPSGNVNLVVLPQQAIDNLKEKFEIKEIVDSELETTENPKLKGEGAVYKLKVKKNVKFLGFLDMPAEFEYEIGTQTGDIVLDKNPWFMSLAGFLFR